MNEINVNKTTKRLLSLTRIGVCIDYESGHRWIMFVKGVDGDMTLLGEILERNNIIPNCKIYGNVIDALNYIDVLLKKVGMESLEEQFDKWNDWGLDDDHIESGVDWEESGIETVEYFEGRIHIGKEGGK